MTDPRPLQCMEILGGLGRRAERLVVQGLDVFLLAEPAPGSITGGDVQYASMCSAGKISRFVVADVSGHGDDVAHFGLALRDLMRRSINTPSQEKMIRELNDRLGDRLDAGHFATAVVVTWFNPTHQAFVCAAGHPHPFWYSAELDQWTQLSAEIFRSGGAGSRMDRGGTNLPLGIVPGTDYQQFTVPLGDGDLLVLYTDHYIEAGTEEGRAPGIDGLFEIVQRCPVGDPESFARAVEVEMSTLLDGAVIEDDRSLMVIRVDDSVRRRVSAGERARGIARSILPSFLVRSRLADLGLEQS